MSAYFYIEYKDGSVQQINFKTPKMARKAYELYGKEPEDTATGWGWEIACDPPTLSQQLRAKKANKTTANTERVGT